MESEKPISVERALELVVKTRLHLPIEEVSLRECVGRILAEDISADRDFPPFDRVMMDGIAVQHTALKEGQKTFQIVGLQPAGTLQQKLSAGSDCIEVMTGSVLPINTDTVIPYENIKISGDTAQLKEVSFQPGQYVHRQGSDHRRGEKLLEKGTGISPAEVSVLATVGKFYVKVFGLPRVAVVSTGDELVEVNEIPAPHQIRKSNTYALLAALRENQVDGQASHLPDNKIDIQEKLKEILSQFDVLLFSGGVSKGKKDFLPKVFEESGIKKIFHRVEQRPGKPFWFGKSEKKVIFGFPGNPVSAFVCFYKYFMPWLKASLNNREKSCNAILAEDFTFKPSLTLFLQVKIYYSDGKIMATPTPGNGSGDLTNLTKADGFIELPPDRQEFKKGEVFPLIRYRII